MLTERGLHFPGPDNILDLVERYMTIQNQFKPMGSMRYPLGHWTTSREVKQNKVTYNDNIGKFPRI
jgi:hypothetical protein